MSPKTRPFSELAEIIDRDPERRTRVEDYKQAILSAMRLAEVRKARGLTQTQLAKELSVTQVNVSQIERAEDTHLSTLRGYIEALGGHLELRAVFDDDEQSIPLALPATKPRPV